MNQVNKIVFTKRDFKDDETLYKKVGEQVRLLIESKNIVTMFDADELGGVIIIEYAHDDEYQPKPFWLTEDEAAVAKDYHDECEVEKCRKILGDSKNHDA